MSLSHLSKGFCLSRQKPLLIEANVFPCCVVLLCYRLRVITAVWASSRCRVSLQRRKTWTGCSNCLQRPLLVERRLSCPSGRSSVGSRLVELGSRLRYLSSGCVWAFYRVLFFPILILLNIHNFFHLTIAWFGTRQVSFPMDSIHRARLILFF